MAKVLTVLTVLTVVFCFGCFGCFIYSTLGGSEDPVSVVAGVLLLMSISFLAWKGRGCLRGCLK